MLLHTLPMPCAASFQAGIGLFNPWTQAHAMVVHPHKLQSTLLVKQYHLQFCRSKFGKITNAEIDVKNLLRHKILQHFCVKKQRFKAADTSWVLEFLLKFIKRFLDLCALHTLSQSLSCSLSLINTRTHSLSRTGSQTHSHTLDQKKSWLKIFSQVFHRRRKNPLESITETLTSFFSKAFFKVVPFFLK